MLQNKGVFEKSSVQLMSSLQRGRSSPAGSEISLHMSSLSTLVSVSLCYSLENIIKCHHSSKTSFRAFHEAKLTINNMIQLKSSIAPAPDMSKSDLVWIKTEVDLSADSCEFCDSVFSRKRDLADHLAKVHEEYVLHCEVCDSVFKHKYLFEEHMKLHEPNIECSQKISDTCSNSSGHDSDSHIHLNTKGKSSRILRVKSPKELNISGKTSEQVSYGCETCGKHFKRLYHLNKHIKTHDTFMKVEAGESETGMSGLGSEDESCNEEEKKEERETTEKKEKTKATYHCQICGKNFTLKDSFKSHQRIHTGEKPFTCHICGKQFSHTGGLYYHLKHVHADEHAKLRNFPGSMHCKVKLSALKLILLRDPYTSDSARVPMRQICARVWTPQAKFNRDWLDSPWPFIGLGLLLAHVYVISFCKILYLYVLTTSVEDHHLRSRHEQHQYEVIGHPVSCWHLLLFHVEKLLYLATVRYGIARPLHDIPSCFC
ncbi:hypothetical protein ANN_23768 [Periplaneta americana]|uniref:C2H2-type domain-containing protein n=1 Tax=Periplaneta americana TaxID=6978 RepID=A0ABQ8SM14_PERAM|nr:hypothetical protein ANN_23768 [Periplaneta americana]